MKPETKRKLEVAFTEAIQGAENEIEAQLLKDFAYELNLHVYPATESLFEQLAGAFRPR